MTEITLQTKITLNIGGNQNELTLDEAKNLLAQLKNALGENNNCTYPTIPNYPYLRKEWDFPEYPNYPVYPQVWYSTNSNTNNLSSNPPK